MRRAYAMPPPFVQIQKEIIQLLVYESGIDQRLYTNSPLSLLSSCAQHASNGDIASTGEGEIGPLVLSTTKSWNIALILTSSPSTYCVI